MVGSIKTRRQSAGERGKYKNKIKRRRGEEEKRDDEEEAHLVRVSLARAIAHVFSSSPMCFNSFYSPSTLAFYHSIHTELVHVYFK